MGMKDWLKVIVATLALTLLPAAGMHGVAMADEIDDLEAELDEIEAEEDLQDELDDIEDDLEDELDDIEDDLEDELDDIEDEMDDDL